MAAGMTQSDVKADAFWVAFLLLTPWETVRDGGLSFFRARTQDYVGEIRQKGLSGDGEEAGFLSHGAKPSHFPWGYFPAWLSDCPGAVIILRKYISSEGERWLDQDGISCFSITFMMKCGIDRSKEISFALYGWPMFIDKLRKGQSTQNLYIFPLLPECYQCRCVGVRSWVSRYRLSV